MSENIRYSGNWFGDSLSACPNSQCIQIDCYKQRDGFQRGVKDAGRDLQGSIGHGFDDSCPKGHTSTFCEGCEGYKQG
jgi:hypothetical protein